MLAIRKSLLAAVCAAVARAASHGAVPITYSGYILDYECYLNRVLAGGAAPDGSNIISAPSEHKAKCLLLGANDAAPCEPNGYYMAQTCGGSGNYHPKFDLRDPDTHAAAVAYIQTIDPPTSDNVLVTVEALNDHGVLKNAKFSACTGNDCDGFCNDTMHCHGVDDDAHCTDNSVTYSGYIIDWYCHGRFQNGMLAPDNSDIILEPWNHTAGCLLLDNCKNSGFYLAEKLMNGSYFPKYSLMHPSSHDTVTNFLTAHRDANGASSKDVMVTVSGISHEGVLHNAHITLCTKRDASGNERGCDSVCTGNCACSLTDTSGCVAAMMSTTAADTTSAALSFAMGSAVPGAAAVFSTLVLLWSMAF